MGKTHEAPHEDMHSFTGKSDLSTTINTLPNQSLLTEYIDDDWVKHKHKISAHGMTLLAHTNYTLLKFCFAFKKTNIE